MRSLTLPGWSAEIAAETSPVHRSGPCDEPISGPRCTHRRYGNGSIALTGSLYNRPSVRKMTRASGE